MCMLQTKYRNLRRSLFQQTSVTTPKAQKEEDQSHSDRGAAQAVRGEPGGVLWCKFLLWERICRNMQRILQNMHWVSKLVVKICVSIYKCVLNSNLHAQKILRTNKYKILQYPSLESSFSEEKSALDRKSGSKYSFGLKFIWSSGSVMLQRHVDLLCSYRI